MESVMYVLCTKVDYKLINSTLKKDSEVGAYFSLESAKSNMDYSVVGPYFKYYGNYGTYANIDPKDLYIKKVTTVKTEEIVFTNE